MISDSHNTTLYLSDDGSHTLYSERFGQYFHNPNGAIAESRHIFFEIPALRNRLISSDRLNIFEVGFGTGLNFLILLELLQSMNDPPVITYRSVEKFPISPQQAKALNYPDLIHLNNGSSLLEKIFRNLEPGLNILSYDDTLSLEIFAGPFEKHPETNHTFHAIFFDPFSPDINPELWQPGVFQKLASLSSKEVLLTTYGAASAARAAMAVAGWHVARAPGALGKREMTVAALNPDLLDGWKRVNEERLIERWGAGEFQNLKTHN